MLFVWTECSVAVMQSGESPEAPAASRDTHRVGPIGPRFASSMFNTHRLRFSDGPNRPLERAQRLPRIFTTLDTLASDGNPAAGTLREYPRIAGMPPELRFCSA